MLFRSRLVERRLPIERHERLTKDVVELFRVQRLDSKVQLLETTHELYTTYYTLDTLADSYYGPLAPNTSVLKVFDLIPYADGMLLLPPGRDVQEPATPTERNF